MLLAVGAVPVAVQAGPPDDNPLLERLPASELVSARSRAYERYGVLTSAGVDGPIRSRNVDGRSTDLVYRVAAERATPEQAYRAYRRAITRDRRFELQVDCRARTQLCAHGLLRRWADLSGRAERWWGVDTHAVELARDYRLMTALAEDGGAMTLVVSPDPDADGRTLVLISIVEPDAGSIPVRISSDPIARRIQARGRAVVQGLAFEMDPRSGPHVEPALRIAASGRDAVAALARYLKERDDAYFLLTGHYTRMYGDNGARCRSAVVKRTLRNEYGITGDRLEVACMPPVQRTSAQSARAERNARGDRVELIER